MNRDGYRPFDATNAVERFKWLAEAAGRAGHEFL